MRANPCPSHYKDRGSKRGGGDKRSEEEDFRRNQGYQSRTAHCKIWSYTIIKY